MDERIMQFRVGVMVFATLLIAAILVAMFGEMPNLVHGSYTIKIAFAQAPGVREGTPVRKSGIHIGRVTKVEFARGPSGRPDTRVLVTAQIEGDKSIYPDEACYVQSNLLGDAALEFIRVSGKPVSTEPLKPGAQINGVYTPDPATMIGDMQRELKESISSVTGTSRELAEVSKTFSTTLCRVNNMLDENRAGLNAAVQQSSKTLESVDMAARSLQRLIGDNETQQAIKDSMRRLPQIAEETECTLRTVRQAASQMDRTFGSVERITNALGSEQVLGRLSSSAANLDRTMATVAEFTDKLNNSNGSLGRMVRDPELYENLNRAARNIERVTREVQPILDDARVLSDKVSRHPGVIIRDAIKPGPGIK